MKKRMAANNRVLAGILLGALAGYLYWKHVGCESGKCLVTANPFMSIGYGGMMGGLLLSLLPSRKQKQDTGV